MSNVYLMNNPRVEKSTYNKILAKNWAMIAFAFRNENSNKHIENRQLFTNLLDVIDNNVRTNSFDEAQQNNLQKLIDRVITIRENFYETYFPGLAPPLLSYEPESTVISFLKSHQSIRSFMESQLVK
jgi:FMN-dependent NADH-azoreductase